MKFSDRFLYFLLISLSILVLPALALAAGPLPPAHVTPLPWQGPAGTTSWSTDPATIAGVTISGKIQGNGFVQEDVALPDGTNYYYQQIQQSDFLSETYVKKLNSFANPTHGLVSANGNAMFYSEVKDPYWGFDEKVWTNGFNQPVNIHADQNEALSNVPNVAPQLAYHFRQIPYVDTATNQVMLKQDIGVYQTGYANLLSTDITKILKRTASHDFSPAYTNMLNRIATTADTIGGLDFWSDMTVTKIINPVTQQIVSYSKCNDFDLIGRRGIAFSYDGGTRGGCSASGSTSGSTQRPAIENFASDDYQQTPINWDRWGAGGGGSGLLMSGGTGGQGGLTSLPGTGAPGPGPGGCSPLYRCR